MRASIFTILGALVATGCSHHDGKSTTEEIRQAPGAEADTQGGMAPANSDPDCPMQVPGTSVRTEETISGPALAFTTTGDVEELRMRVRRMAAANNRASQQATTKPAASADDTSGFPSTQATHPGPNSAAVPSMYSLNSKEAPAGSTSTQSDMLSQMERPAGVVTTSGSASQPAQARAENTESGARLVFVIKDASQLERVRDRVQTSAQTLASGRCPASTMNVQNSPKPDSSSYQRPAAGGATTY